MRPATLFSDTHPMTGLLRPALIGGVLGLALGAAALFVVPQQFEASGAIKLGQVEDKPIEPSAASLQRLRSRALQERVTEKLGIGAGEARLFRETLWATAPRGAESLLEVRLRAYDRDTARALFNEVAAALSLAHSEIAAKEVSRRAAALDQARRELRAVDAARAELERSVGNIGRLKPSEQFAETIAYTRVLADRDQQRVELQKRIDRLEEGLASSRTFPTAPVEAPSVTERAVFPKPSAFLAAGLTIGVAVGVAVAGLRRRLFR